MQVVDDLHYHRVYWVRGDMPTRDRRLSNEVKDPPTSGWQHAFVIKGEKRSTIFCPFSLTAFQVTNRSAEMQGLEDPRDTFDTERLVRIMTDNWAQFQGFGWMRDYDTTALILRRLGAPVPEQVMRGGEEDTRKKGGKEVAKALAKPVKRDGKRGQFLAWFLEAGGSRPIREAMAQFSMSRSNALSYLFMLKKDHGIGYELVGDTATVVLPDGCVDPFTSQEEQDAKGPAASVAADDDWLDEPEPKTEEPVGEDDSWLD